MDFLVSYESSDESPSEPGVGDESDATISNQAQKEKRINRVDTDMAEVSPKRRKLPLPSSIQNMFDSHEREVKDDPEDHGGRVRTFGHERGNWASYVFIKLADPDDMMPEFISDVIGCLKPLNFKPMDDLHISLSRTFVLRHHWIDALVSSLSTSLKKCRRCVTDMEKVRLFTNDEKTRTFVSVQLGANTDTLKSYVTLIDQCLKDFKLPSYYEDPSFHVSIAWAVGDVTTQISDEQLQEINSLLADLMETCPRLSVISVNELHLKAGNKVYALPLG